MTPERTIESPPTSLPVPPPRCSADEPAELESAGAVRVLLRDTEPATTSLDGAWWPRSTDLAAELPALIRCLPVSRVCYNPQLWDPAPRKLRVDGRTVRLSWFHGIDPHRVTLISGNGVDRVELLVVPPGAPPGAAARAMRAVRDGTGATPAEVLLAAGAVDEPGTESVGGVAPGERTSNEPPRLPGQRHRDRRADLPAISSWEPEGGHLRG